MLENKKINFTKLVNYGFIKKDDNYFFEKRIVDNQFEMKVIANTSGKLETKVIDVNTNDEYILHLKDSVSGAFVGQVRDEYEDLLQDIINKCTDVDVFKSTQTIEVIEFIKEKYHDELEFLWAKFPNNAVFRNKESKKWYAAILSVKPEVINKSGSELIEVIDLHFSSERVNELLDNKVFLPGYHMNKKYWITICLDNTVSISVIKRLIDESYNNSNITRKSRR
ncbi:hypothetical protein RD055328_12400 [Companilactobacillus sp. RD055328]|uniref:MmcQ/YjbR family DNA-binding protein n=1 Tax=Companilactobacillus sp. RD055328 TaxID=2916634 RepID=UPI001FC7D0F1|nr:MmcQ/YjbR family DNA-binding protein [Companilactobacillus sp. RD055328]GKQ43317.1 hypothetical protein RD055328_12400 [Companilactobacillus sp. RD055328]